MCTAAALPLHPDQHQSSRALLTRQRAAGAESVPASYLNLQLSVDGGDDGVPYPDMTEHVRLMFEITWGPVLSMFSEVSRVFFLLVDRDEKWVGVRMGYGV